MCPDVAGYHCKACKCVMSNKGLQKPPILKKKKKKKGLSLSKYLFNFRSCSIVHVCCCQFFSNVHQNLVIFIQSCEYSSYWRFNRLLYNCIVKNFYWFAFLGQMTTVRGGAIIAKKVKVWWKLHEVSEQISKK